MKHISAKITAVVLSVAMTAGMMSACTTSSEESGAKEMLLTAFDSMTKYTSDTWSAITDNTEDRQSGAKASVTFEPGEYIDDLAGTDVKAISIDAENKVKGNIVGSNINVSYDGKAIADVDAIIDSANELGYIKIAELSDKYIKAPMDEAGFNDLLGVPDLGLDLDAENEDVTDDTYTKTKIEQSMDVLGEFDVKGIVSDIDSVIAEVNKSFPESDDEGEKTIKENGVEAVFKTKTIEFSKEDNEKVEKAAKEALKNSENIKACLSKIGNYDDLINDMFEADDDDESSDNERITFYYYGDKLVGFGEDNKNYLVSADTKDGYITVLKVNEDSDNVSLALTAVPDGDKLDIEFNLTIDMSDSSTLDSSLDIIEGESGAVKLKINDFELVNKDIGSFNSNVDGEFSVMSDDENTIDCKFKADYKGDNNKQEVSGEVTAKVDGKDKSVIKYSGVSEQTDASDIKVPEESDCIAADSISSIFTKDALASWGSKVSDALGEDLIAKLSEKIMQGYDDYDITGDSLLSDLEINYGIDYYDYYNDTYTEFDMDKFLSDAKKVYPADKFDDLKEEIEDVYESGFTSTPHIDTLYSDYDIDIDDYFDDNYSSFDKDKFMEDAKKVYPKDKLDELEDEADDYAESMKDIMSSLSDLAS